ncbi:hypothetical protein BDN67DRAFT_200284 [Paxillus ammoniavirescens]|nr:hypothetical protein BDN67DRAFT_200284 [Paxillus ammoniavirescens]
MSRSPWTVDGPDDVALEVEGRKFSTNDEGAPMMCNKQWGVTFTSTIAEPTTKLLAPATMNYSTSPSECSPIQTGPRTCSHTTYSGRGAVSGIHIQKKSKQTLPSGALSLSRGMGSSQRHAWAWLNR